MLSIASVQFDVANWQIKQRSEQKIVWFNQIPDILILEFSPHPIELPADLQNMDAVCTFVEQMVRQNAGAVVSVENLQRGEVEIVKSIFKYRQTASSKRSPLGMVYAGLYILPFAECHYLLKVQCSEYGTTGLREAAVSASQQDQAENTSASVVYSLDEMFATSVLQRVVAGLWDDEKYDAAFPLHPLSRLRNYLRHIEATFTTDEMLKSARPFRKNFNSQML